MDVLIIFQIAVDVKFHVQPLWPHCVHFVYPMGFISRHLPSPVVVSAVFFYSIYSIELKMLGVPTVHIPEMFGYTVVFESFFDVSDMFSYSH